MRKILPSLLAALLGFIVGFGVSFQNDRIQLERFVRGALPPLLISVKTGDDLMALDWARHFEDLEGVEAFRAVCGGKVIASGGLLDLLASGPGSKFEWLPPMRYRLRLAEDTMAHQRLELEIILQSSPGPFIWGAAAAFLCLLGVWLQRFLGSTPKPLSNPLTPQPKPAPSKTRTTTVGGTIPSSSASTNPNLPTEGHPTRQPSLRLDSRWTVQEFSDDIPDIFGIPPNDLLGHHLLDLDPHPTLLRLLEKAQKDRTSQGFNRFPSMEIEITPIEDEGILLTFPAKGKPS